jgi:predicted hotdog family 3-hydroxylacyl-ACP dehydratase
MDPLALPMDAERLIPHRPPMRLVDRLLSFEDGGGLTESRLPAGSVLAGEDGAVDPVALVELIAQSYATVKGYDDRVHGRPVAEGFLVGIRKLRIPGKAFAGDRLLTSVKTVGTFEGFAVVEGAVARDGETIASGTMKLWIVDRPADGGGRA